VIHEVESSLKVGELEGASDVMFVDDLPVRKLVREIVKLAALQRRHVALAGNASLTG
jgi:hypothetical protein